MAVHLCVRLAFVVAVAAMGLHARAAAAIGTTTQLRRARPATPASAAPAYGATLGYQTHSYNDLREWPQMMRKGARFVKIDPQYAAAAVCAAQARGGGDARGCLLLSHNDVVSSRTDYNSTGDLLAALAAPEWRPFVTAPRPLTVSLCFKAVPGAGGHACGNDTASRDWLSLVDELVADAEAAVADHGLNVRFVLDGGAAPVQCLAQRWRPWVATWITGDAPQDAFTSDNVSLGYDRFQVLNEPVAWFGVAALFGYGKFASSSNPHTWLLWEPSDEDTIDRMAGIYRDAGVVHAPGLRFAINIDPAQWLLYAADHTGRGWHDDVPASATASAPAVTVVPGDSNNTALAVWQVPSGAQNESAVVFSTMTFAGTHGPTLANWSAPAALPFLRSAFAPTQLSTAPPHAAGARALLLLAGADGAAALASFDRATGGISLLEELDLLPSNASAVASASASLVGASPRGSAVLAVQAFAPQAEHRTACGLYLQLWEIESSGTGATAIGPPACAAAGVVVDSVSVAAAVVPGAASLLRAVVGYSGVLAASNSSNSTVFNAVACVRVDDGAAWVNAAAANDPCRARGGADGGQASRSAAAGLAGPTGPGALPAAVATHVGRNPSVSVATTALDVAPNAAVGLYFAQTWSDGWCPNCEVHNKDAYGASLACRDACRLPMRVC